MPLSNRSDPKRRQYRNPPIEEAVCEFLFVPGPEWDLTVPGRFHTEIKDFYPGKPRQQRGVVLEAAVPVVPSQVAPEDPRQILRLIQALAKVQFPSTDGKRLVAVGPDLLSIHVLRPYGPGWQEDFRPRIEQALAAYQKAAEPHGVKRVGLRYINRISIPGDTADLSGYFNLQVGMPDSLRVTLGGFLSRTESNYGSDPVRLIVTYANIDPQPAAHSAFLLDIDVIWERPTEPMPLEELYDPGR